jgi:WD40 repeat protein
MEDPNTNSDDLDFSPDNKLLATTHVYTECVHLWDLETLQPLQRHLKLSDHAGGLGFSPDGKWLATASGHRYSAGAPGEIKIWSTSTWEPRDPILEPTNSLTRVKYSRDQRYLAASGTDGFVKVWDASTFRELAQLKGMRGFVLGLCFSPDSRLLAAADSEGMIRLWTVGTWEERLAFAAHPRMIHRIVFSPDSQVLASGSLDQTVKLWNIQNGALLSTLRGHYARVYNLSFSPDGSLLASSSEDGTVKLWSPFQRPEPLVFKGHKGVWLVQVGFSSDGQWLGMTTNEVANTSPVTNSPGSSPVVLRTALYSSDGRHLVADLPGHPFAFAQGGIIATKTASNAITLWHISQSGPQTRTTLTAPTALQESFALSPDSTLLAARSATDRIYLWNLRTRAEPRTIQQDGEQIDADLLFSANADTLIVANRGQGTIEYWDTATLQQTVSIPVETNGDGSRYRVIGFPLVASNHGPGFPLALSSDGQTLAAMGSNQTPWLWDFRSRRKIRELRGTRERLFSLSFSPDGRTLAAGGFDGGLKLYNLPCGSEVATMPAHKSICHSVSFSPDGTRIATAGVDDTIKIWSAPTFSETDRP